MKKLLGIPALITIAAASTLTSCTSADDTSEISAPETTQEQADEPTIYRQYVALGDSYAAMGSRDAQVTGPAECFRSGDNYPAVLAGDDRIKEFVDATCASAVTHDITSVRTGDEGFISAQVDSLTEDTDLVTISIGGNDIGFPDIARCFQEATAAGTE